MKHVIIYTDGACSPNPGPGGWGAVLLYGQHRKEIFGGEPRSTNNRMEIMAAIMALEALKEPCRVDLYTDSQYLRDAVHSWMPKWKALGWRRPNKRGNPSKRPVKNVDLWKRLDAQLQRHDVTFHWVRGHSGVKENERADELARAGVRDAALKADLHDMQPGYASSIVESLVYQ